MQTEWSPENDESSIAPEPARWSPAHTGAVAVDDEPSVGAATVEVEPAIEIELRQFEHGQVEHGQVAGPEQVAEEELHRAAVDAVDGLLDEVELALARLDDGTYGRCEACGEPIVDDRLARLPIARTCGNCDQVDGGAPATGPVEPVTA